MKEIKAYVAWNGLGEPVEISARLEDITQNGQWISEVSSKKARTISDYLLGDPEDYKN
ncbi:MAG: hypothetical protein ABIE22_04925 [archaeon]